MELAGSFNHDDISTCQKDDDKMTKSSSYGLFFLSL